LEELLVVQSLGRDVERREKVQYIQWCWLWWQRRHLPGSRLRQWKVEWRFHGNGGVVEELEAVVHGCE
jgi:hypothetical protein